MATVRTFRLNPRFGVPDKEIQEFLSKLEEKSFISVQTQFIPSIGDADPRLTIIVTTLDDK